MYNNVSSTKINAALGYMTCFRHLEKPIKTKENKVKHLFLT